MIIGFTGIARCGKTTAAQIFHKRLSENQKFKIRRYSFADPIKRGLEEMGVTKEKNYDEYRHLAQYIGTDVLRNKYPNWWVDQAKENIYELQMEAYASNYVNVKNPDTELVIIIDDVRFENERQMIRDLGGILIFVECGDRIDLTKEVYQHQSEKLSVDYQKYFNDHNLVEAKEYLYHDSTMRFDYVISNRGSLEQYEKICVQLCESIPQLIKV